MRAQVESSLREQAAKPAQPEQQKPEINFTPVRVQSSDEEKLNKTEKAYLANLRYKHATEIGIQNVTLKLADDCRLTPDFNYINADGEFVFVDVKGFQREDALIKMKVAARMYRWARFQIVFKDKTQPEGWMIKKVNP
jgi:hypothetical protein